MSSPRSCRRCSNLLAHDAPSGLCPDCAARADTGAETAGPTSRTPSDPVPAARPDPDAPTATFIPATDLAAPVVLHPPTATDPLGHDAFVSSASFRVAGDAPSARTTVHPLPVSPPGYELLDALGGGGMGDVYLAREQASERRVAMKFLRFPGNSELLERFTLELRVLAKLDHPNIVRVLASDFLRAGPFFTMEYLEPGSLGHAIRQRGPFAPGEAVGLIRAVAGALSAAHAQNVIHRDLKPSNILLTADGTPKVADFGLAKRLDEADPLTLFSGGLGTPSYMPPEQISRKNGALGPWSDVYGLGATLYHLLTGHAPFLGESVQEIIPRVLNEPPRRPRALDPEVPMALEAIVLKCLEKNPKDRYPSMAALVADLDRYEAGLRPVAPKMTRLRRGKRWAVRNRFGVIAAFVAMTGLAAAFELGTTARPEPEAPPKDYWATVRDELAAGRRVTLIPEVGTPRRSEWKLGAAVFGAAPTGDGSCYFETVDRALLDLLDDPGIDRYRIRADLRQVHSGVSDNAQAPRRDENDVGVYFGRTTGVAPNRDAVQAFFRVAFRDYDPTRRATGKVTEQRARFDCVLSVVRPQRPALEPYDTFATCPFRPADVRPGNWYTIEIDVGPEEIAARLVTKDGVKPLVGVPPFKPVELYAALQPTVDGLPPPPTGITIPKWTPRLPLGLYVGSSALTVRNFTITPLPEPR